MPFPIVQQPIDTLSSAAKGCRIFVSYSHRDMEGAKQFIKFFSLKLHGAQELCITTEQVFFDRKKLLAGDEWDESIQHALEEAQYFILLVSVDSLSSKYCLSRELSKAGARVLTIIPILLDHCPWKEQPVPEDPKKRKLGDLGALPDDDQFGLRPISAWPEKDRGYAWTLVVEQLTTRIQRDQKQPAPSPIVDVRSATTQPQPWVTPLLPYFCNQISTVNQFNDGVREWNRNALLILTRGLYEDNVSSFWDRLRTKNLSDYLTARKGQLLEPKRFVWPFTADRRLSAKEMLSDMMDALSESLTGNSFQLNDGPSLSQWLAALSGVVPLVTLVPNQSKKLIASGLRALLDLLEQCPIETPLDRLVIVILFEDNNLLREKDLGKALKVIGHQRVHLIDLTPLKEIKKGEILDWHRFYEVEKLCRVSEEKLLQTVLSGKSARHLRLRTFAEKVKAFL